MKNKNIVIIVCIISIIAIVIATIIGIIRINKMSNFSKRLEEVTTDSVEIERKWLIDANSIPLNLKKAQTTVEIEQTYINFSPEMRIRKYTNKNKETCYEFTLKANLRDNGAVRDESNVQISKEEYDNLYNKKEGNTIKKTRYQILGPDRQIYAIDVFDGDLKGLATLEVEFATQEEADNFASPDWVIRDVTSDVRYKNGSLARYGIPQ